MDLDRGLVDRRVFADPELYQLEQERVFARCWLYLGHESEIPRPGDFVSTYMGENPVLLCRDGNGRVRAFLNMCRHRGNRVCRLDRGNTESFECSYHGWTFSNEGKLVGIPMPQHYRELDREAWGLIPVAQLDTYKGMIFEGDPRHTRGAALHGYRVGRAPTLSHPPPHLQRSDQATE